jgi:hypothetical protein
LEIHVIIVIDDMDLFVVRVIRSRMATMTIGVTEGLPVHDNRSIGLPDPHSKAVYLDEFVLVPVSLLRLVLDDQVYLLILLVKVKETG